MARLDQERQKKLEPERMQCAKDKISALGFQITFESSTTIRFVFKGSQITLYPYSGWHTGSTIKDGRGLNKLIQQLKQDAQQ